MKIAQRVRGKSKTVSTITHSSMNRDEDKVRGAVLYSTGTRIVTTHDRIKATGGGGRCCGVVMVGLGGGMRAGRPAGGEGGSWWKVLNEDTHRPSKLLWTEERRLRIASSFP